MAASDPFAKSCRLFITIRYFRHIVEGRRFTIFTDHKPITFASRQKAEKCSPRQFRHLDYIGQFTTDIRHISGKDNIVADAFSRIMDVSKGIDFPALALSQDQDEKLQNYLQPNSSLKLTKVPIVSSKLARPFITKPFRKAVFDSPHQFSHPGINASVKLVTQCYVCPSIRADCRKWARACLDCQRSKISRHVSSPIGTFTPPSSRFEHVHTDIVSPLPTYRGFNYCLTCVDRFSRWPEAFPITKHLGRKHCKDSSL